MVNPKTSSVRPQGRTPVSRSFTWPGN